MSTSHMLQLLLRNIRLNRKTGFYEAYEAGAKYEIDPFLIDGLSEFLKENPKKLVADWHRTLDNMNIMKAKKFYL